MVVGQPSGHCVKPKKSTTTLPCQSSSLRGLPVWSVSASVLPYSAPVMSALLNLGPLSQPATSARLKIMIDEKRSKQRGQVDDRIAEGFLRQGVAVGRVDAQGVGDERPAEHQRGGKVDHAAHADRV